MAKFFIPIILFVCNSALGQKYMIIGHDTLPFKAKMIISKDTTHQGTAVFIKSDTTYEDPCHVFEIANGKVINRTDSSCIKQGLWIFPVAGGNYYTSIYFDGDDSGKSKEYDKNGRLLKEIEEARLGSSFYTVYEIDYRKGRSVTVVNERLFGFFITNFFVLVPVLVILSLVRILINFNIYNVENNTSYSSFRNDFKTGLSQPGELKHRLLSFFTIWFFRYKPENKPFVIISNILTMILLGSFIILITGLIFCK